MKQKTRSWLLETIVAILATTCLLLFYFPRQSEELVSIEGYEKHGSYLEHKEIYPTLGILFGQYYRCLHLSNSPTTFLLDFALPGTYSSGDSLRLWIRPRDQEKISADPDIEVRVYAVDFQNTYTHRWTHCIAEHPHGHGAFLALGIILTMLFLVLLVKKVFFDLNKKSFP